MFNALKIWWVTPRHIRMSRRELRRAQCDLVNSQICAEYYTAQVATLQDRVKRIDKELRK